MRAGLIRNLRAATLVDSPVERSSATRRSFRRSVCSQAAKSSFVAATIGRCCRSIFDEDLAPTALVNIVVIQPIRFGYLCAVGSTAELMSRTFSLVPTRRPARTCLMAYCGQRRGIDHVAQPAFNEADVGDVAVGDGLGNLFFAFASRRITKCNAELAS